MVLLEHSRLLLDEDYLEDRCQALVRFARRHGRDRNTVVHEPGLGCCRLEAWRVTEATVLARTRAIAAESKRPSPP